MFGCNPAPPAIGLVVVLEAEFGGRIVLLEEEEDFEVTVELVLLLVRDEEVPALLLPQVFVPQSLTMTAGSSSAALRRPLASTTLEAVLSRLDDRKSAVCLLPVSCCC